MRLEIHGARVVDPASNRDEVVSIFIADGHDRRARQGARRLQAPTRRIDAKGLVACPGLVDLCARLREPGFEYKATLESEMRAAVAGGVTTLACPPDTDPALDEPGLVEMLTRRAEASNQARVHPLGALTVGLKGEKLAEMAELAEAGCVGFFQANAPIARSQRAARRRCATRRPSASPCGCARRTRTSRAAASRTRARSPRAWASRAIPAIAETVAVRTILRADRRHRRARAPGAALERRRAWRSWPKPRRAACRITCDVGVAPPAPLRPRHRRLRRAGAPRSAAARSRATATRCARALADGTIDAVCSDHTPVDDDEKLVPFAEAAPGATGLELLLPLTLKWGTEIGPEAARRRWAPPRTAPRASSASSAGTLAPGARADICLFDPQSPWVVAPLALASQGKNTPFMGLELIGRVARTLVGGRTVYSA